MKKLGLVVGILALVGCSTVGDSSDREWDIETGQPSGGVTQKDARFFLPTDGEPHNTSAPTVEIDAKGGVHAVYPGYSGGGAYYAFCAPGCADEKSVKVVRLDAKNGVANAMLALDSSGAPHVLLGASTEVVYAHAVGDPTAAASWKQTTVLEHAGAKEVTGEAFALDREGRPRFLMHTTVAKLGIGQKTPETHWVACDTRCDDASSWTATKITDGMWQSSQLRFDAQNRAKVATVIRTKMSPSSSGEDMAAYVEADGDPTKEESWKGLVFGLAFSSSVKAVPMPPAISMALTKAGAPRIVYMGTDSQTSGKRVVTYFECDADCAGDNWKSSIVTDDDRIQAGLDLALDGSDRPRIAYNLDFNIGLAWFDGTKWDSAKVEAGGDMPTDDIFLWENCYVGAWFLHDPSIAIGPSGEVRVGYQARDMSGGTKNPDKNKPRCEAGTDMTLTRLALLAR